MNPTSNHIFENRVIDLTVIEDPCFGYTSIHLISEDDKWDVIRLYIYNIEHNKEAEEKLAHGSRIGILNPNMRIGSLDLDTINGIRVVNQDVLYFWTKGKTCVGLVGI